MNTMDIIEQLLETVDDLSEDDRQWIVNIAYTPNRILTIDEKLRLKRLYDRFYTYGVE